MFERELIILGLRRQQTILGNLIEGLEGKPGWNGSDEDWYFAMTHRVAKNLRKLRKIKDNYLTHRN